MTLVLVVDDEAPIRRTLAANLRVRGYESELASGGRQALVLAANHPPDAVILDLGLPDINGIDVVRGLRGWTTVPIVILSARDTEDDKVDALEAGADDYVTKPFGVDELFARLRAAMRHHLPAADNPTVVTPDFWLDLPNRTAGRTDGRPCRLTRTEWQIVEFLARHPGQLVTQRRLLQYIGDAPAQLDTSLMRVHLAHIRRKLEPDPARPRYFLTEPRMGYRFVTGD